MDEFGEGLLAGIIATILCGALVFAIGSATHRDEIVDTAKYRVLQTYGYETMEKEINELAEDGWQRNGELSAQAYPDPTASNGMTVIVTQVMSK